MAARWVALVAVLLGAVLVAWAARATAGLGRHRCEQVAVVVGALVLILGVAGTAVL